MQNEQEEEEKINNEVNPIGYQSIRGQRQPQGQDEEDEEMLGEENDDEEENLNADYGDEEENLNPDYGDEGGEEEMFEEGEVGGEYGGEDEMDEDQYSAEEGEIKQRGDYLDKQLVNQFIEGK